MTPHTDRQRPQSTYRLQVTPDFDLYAAASRLAYLHDLGVDWVYLSPLLASEPGSQHGYDVVAFDHVDPERGGEEGLAALSAEARRLGMGVLVDIVPNHVGVATPSEDPWWWDVLKLGRESEHASAFDVDWAAGDGRIVIPVIGDDDEDAIRIEGGEVRYHDQRFPLAPGTTTLEEQHFELVNWRTADDDLNYRRFFAVNTLAAVRVEDPEVFADTHVEIRRWFEDGLVDGLRVDHPDGLRDPKRYLDDLAALTGDAYVLVEKILEPGETLPTSWATAGTTGYDVLALIDRILTDPAGEEPLDRLEGRLRGAPVDWAQVIHDNKRAVADGILHSEVKRITREVLRIAEEAVEEAGRGRRCRAARLLPGLPLLPARGSPPPRPGLRRGARTPSRPGRDPRPARARPQRRVGTTRPALPADVRDGHGQGGRGLLVLPLVAADLAQRGRRRPVGVRRRRRDLPRRDGAAPARVAARDDDHVDPRHQARRGRTRPHHGAGRAARGVGGRARRAAGAWSPFPTPPSARLLWQAILGAWTPNHLPDLPERLHAYAEKAMREAGDRTTWTEPDEAYEAAVHAAVDAVFTSPEVQRVLTDLCLHVDEPGRSNSLALKLVALTVPGVPDVYQGSELWETSLVDPDNRRPVDFDHRAGVLAGTASDDAVAKLHVTCSALTLRRERPELFTVVRPGARHRTLGRRTCWPSTAAARSRSPPGFRWVWPGQVAGATPGLELPEGSWHDLLTGTRTDGGLAALLAVHPVALLVKDA